MKVKVENGEEILVFSDIHIGTDKHGYSHDRNCIDLAMQICEVTQPSKIIILGDGGEFKNVMRHLKKPDKKCDAQDELDWLYEFFVFIIAICPNTEVFFMEGNHEDMFSRYLYENAPNLSSLRCLNVPAQLDLDELGVKWLDHRTHMELGHLTLIHGQFLSGSKSGNAAHKGIIHYGNSYGQGHCHTLAKVYQTKQDGMHVAFETGHMRSQNPDYIQKVKPWQQGFASIKIYEDGMFHADVHPFIDKGNEYLALYDGITYRSKTIKNNKVFPWH